MSASDAHESLVNQLESLYAEKDKLKEELGVSSADEIIAMVDSLTNQVESLYEKQDKT